VKRFFPKKMWLNSRPEPELPPPPHQLWDDDDRWILMFDNVLKHPGGKTRGCRCDVHGESRLLYSFLRSLFIDSDLHVLFINLARYMSGNSSQGVTAAIVESYLYGRPQLIL
jgi:hypothetical protein